MYHSVLGTQLVMPVKKRYSEVRICMMFDKQPRDLLESMSKPSLRDPIALLMNQLYIVVPPALARCELT